MSPPLCAWLRSGIVRLLADGVQRGAISPSEIVACLARAVDVHVIEPNLFRQLGIDPGLLARCQRENPRGAACLYLEAGIVGLIARGVESGALSAESIVNALSVGYRQGLLMSRTLRAVGLDPKLLMSCETAPAPGPGIAHDLAAAESPFPGINIRHLK